MVRFSVISGEFGRAMVRILARRSWAKIPMARLKEPDMPPKCTEKVRLGIYRTKFSQKSGDVRELRRHCFSLNVSVLVGKHRAIGERV